MRIKKAIKFTMNKLPYIKRLYLENQQFKQNSSIPAGHYYSPIVSVEDLKKREGEIWEKRDCDGINGVDLRTDEQLILIDALSKFYKDLPFREEKQMNLRYNFENNFYSYTDGIMLYSMLRHFKPKRVVEVGSGFSSAVILDTNEIFFNNEIQLTFIDPNMKRLFSLMNEIDKERVNIISDDVQSVSLDVFKELESGDILFIDSTHITKTGSDVNFILFEILPSLQSGVLIHFHDIFYPFEYPKEWVFGGRNWNENYILKAFLMYNDKFKIRLFSEYLHTHHKESFEKMPLCFKNTGGNLWIEKK